MKKYNPKETTVETSNCIVQIMHTDEKNTTVYIDTKNGNEVYKLRIVGKGEHINVYDW
tara:strand:- start:1966 stop:2139 length:174 start_codon:yes stop_codon:yes gene_type:complete